LLIDLFYRYHFSASTAWLDSAAKGGVVEYAVLPLSVSVLKTSFTKQEKKKESDLLVDGPYGLGHCLLSTSGSGITESFRII